MVLKDDVGRALPALRGVSFMRTGPDRLLLSVFGLVSSDLLELPASFVDEEKDKVQVDDLDRL
jgi:hypothetical protein